MKTKNKSKLELIRKENSRLVNRLIKQKEEELRELQTIKREKGIYLALS